MGGANSHVILKSFAKEKINHGIPDDFLPRIVCVSGRTEEAVEVIFNCVSFLVSFSVLYLACQRSPLRRKPYPI